MLVNTPRKRFLFVIVAVLIIWQVMRFLPQFLFGPPVSIVCGQFEGKYLKVSFINRDTGGSDYSSPGRSRDGDGLLRGSLPGFKEFHSETVAGDVPKGARADGGAVHPVWKGFGE